MSQDPIEPAELERLLQNVVYQQRLNYYEGLEVIRRLLSKGHPELLVFLQDTWDRVPDEQRPAIGFALAEFYRQAGDVASLRALYESNDPRTRKYVLNALWSEPGDNPEMGPCIVELALRGAADADAGVRTEACSVFQNQADWGVDVSDAVEPLHALLEDPDPSVRRQAACAVGNLSKKRYPVAGTIPLLAANLEHMEGQVRNYTAWALWQLSRGKCDIGAAVPALVQRLAAHDDYHDVEKNSAGALTHHAKKSGENAAQVREEARAAGVEPWSKPTVRLLEALVSG